MHPSTSSPPPAGPPQDPTRGRADRRERRALAWGLGISVGLHLVVLVLYPLVMDRLTPDAAAPAPDDPVVQLPAMEVIAFREVPPEDVEEEAEVEPEEDVPPEPTVPAPVPPAVESPATEPEVAETEPDEEELGRTLVELLTPQPGDPRLWAPLEQGYMELTDEERAQLMLRGMIRSWSDSMAVAAALSEAARDWTYTDDEGRRWGLSPGRLHLGDFSIPIGDLSIGGPVGFLENRMLNEWLLQDLARGTAQQIIRETWAERARAIRERMDAEREERRNRGDGGGGN